MRPARIDVVTSKTTRYLKGLSNTGLRVTFRKRDGIAIVVSNVVGVGIFTTPAMIAAIAPNPLVMLSLWTVGGLIALAGAASYAQLAERWPFSGGEYIYLSKMYGPVAGFLSGWVSLIAGFSGAVASSAVAAASFASLYIPSLASQHPILSAKIAGLQVHISAATVTAGCLIAIFAVLHICSLEFGKRTQNALAILVVSILVLFVIIGLHSGRGSWDHFHSGSLQSFSSRWALGLIPVMFTYSGWNAPAYISEEMHSASRSMRPVLLSGTGIVIILYVAMNILYLYALSPVQMAGTFNVAQHTSEILFTRGGRFITPVLIIALLGSISAMTIAGPRVYFAMARDGAFIPAFAQTNHKFGTPALAISLQALWSIVLVLLGRFEQILLYTGFAVILSSALAVAGLLLPKVAVGFTRRKRLAPAVFVAASAAMLSQMLLQSPRLTITGLLFIAAGIPVYAFCRRKNIQHQRWLNVACDERLVASRIAIHAGRSVVSSSPGDPGI